MPHLIIEYSSNLRASIDPDRLVETLHAAAESTGEFPPMSLRTRASERSSYRVGDGHPDNIFVHIVLRIRPGRALERKRELGAQVFAATCACLEPVFQSRPIGLTLEVQEIDTACRFLKNNMPEYWAPRNDR